VVSYSAVRPPALAKPLKQVNNTGFLGMGGWHISAAAKFGDMRMILGLRLAFEQLIAMIVNKLLDCASELQIPSTDFC